MSVRPYRGVFNLRFPAPNLPPTGQPVHVHDRASGGSNCSRGSRPARRAPRGIALCRSPLRCDCSRGSRGSRLTAAVIARLLARRHLTDYRPPSHDNCESAALWLSLGKVLLLFSGPTRGILNA